MTKVCAVYALLMGAALLGTWIVLLVNGNALSPADTPLKSASLLAAEFLTGALLMLGGWGLVTHRSRATTVHLVSLGMLLYVTIYSIGVFDQAANLPATIFFAVVALATTAVVAVEVL